MRWDFFDSFLGIQEIMEPLGFHAIIGNCNQAPIISTCGNSATADQIRLGVAAAADA
jgi:hypothetical protein